MEKQRASIEQIRKLQQSGELELASKACAKLLAGNNSDYLSVSTLFGLILLQQGDGEKGRKYLAKAYKQTSSMDASTLADLGGGYLLLADNPTALSLLTTATQLNPGYPIAHARLGMLYIKTRQFEKARKAMQNALDLGYNHPSIYINLATTLLELGHFDDVLACLKKVSLNDKKQAFVVLQIQINALIALERWQELQKLAVELFNNEKNDPEKLRIAAHIFVMCDQFTQGEESLRQALLIKPDDKNILQDLLGLYQNLGRYAEVPHILDRVIALEPENPEVWIKQAQWLIGHGSSQEAHIAVKKALYFAEGKDDNHRAGALAVLGMWQENEWLFAEAEENFSKSLAIDKYSILSLLGLGNLYLQLGRIDEAVELFRLISEKNLAVGQASLIKTRVFPDDPHFLKKIESIANQPSMEGSVQSGLLFSLAATWDHHKDYNKAFATATQANSAVRQLISYDAEENHLFTDRMIHRFTVNFVRQRQEFGLNDNMPIFVVGMPRSGTTLVEQVLASHPSVFGAGELGGVSYIAQRQTFYGKHAGSGRAYPECLDQLTQVEVMGLAQSHLNELRSISQGALRVVDKMPHNFNHIGLIHLLFPKATIINCFREPRDVAVSNYFTNYQAYFAGMGFAFDLKEIGQHISDYQRLMEHWDKVLPDKILHVHYEDMVEDLEGQARRMIQHVGLEWTPQVLQYQELDRSVKTASSWQVRQPIYKTSKGKWRRYAKFLQPLEEGLLQGRNRSISHAVKELNSSLPPGLFNQAVDDHRAGKLLQAQNAYQQILAVNPNHAGALQMIGILAFQNCQYHKAVKYLLKSSQLNPDNAQCFNNLGAAYSKIGQWQEAETAYGQALKQNPNYEYALTGLAHIKKEK
jgi:tetratricopeptide (TPR) repeat protein